MKTLVKLTIVGLSLALFAGACGSGEEATEEVRAPQQSTTTSTTEPAPTTTTARRATTTTETPPAPTTTTRRITTTTNPTTTTARPTTTTSPTPTTSEWLGRYNFPPRDYFSQFVSTTTTTISTLPPTIPTADVAGIRAALNTNADVANAVLACIPIFRARAEMGFGAADRSTALFTDFIPISGSRSINLGLYNMEWAELTDDASKDAYSLIRCMFLAVPVDNELSPRLEEIAAELAS